MESIPKSTVKIFLTFLLSSRDKDTFKLRSNVEKRVFVSLVQISDSLKLKVMKLLCVDVGGQFCGSETFWRRSGSVFNFDAIKIIP
jgi:hypothetical protein